MLDRSCHVFVFVQLQLYLWTVFFLHLWIVFLVFLDCISRIYGLYFLYLWIVFLNFTDIQHAVAHGVLADSPPHPHPNLERKTWLYGVCISFFNNNNVIKCMGFVFNLSTILRLMYGGCIYFVNNFKVNVWGLYLICQQF